MLYVIEDYNRLLKIRIYIQGENQYRLVPVTKRDGSSIRIGNLIFRGTEEQFCIFLRRIKAKDNATDPPSSKGRTYRQMIQTAKDGTDPYIWIWSKFWNKGNKIMSMNEKITIQKEFKISGTDIILEKGDIIEIYHRTLKKDVDKYTLDALIKRKVGSELSKISSPPYYSEIPLDLIAKILEKYNLVLLQEDLLEWSGMLLGSDSQTTITVGDLTTGQKQSYGTVYKPYTNTSLALSWYKMQSGKFEVVCYLA
jgi:hypothetical protein